MQPLFSAIFIAISNVVCQVERRTHEQPDPLRLAERVLREERYAFLWYAVKMEMLTDNPCKRVTVPKGEKKEKDIYTLEEVAQLFQLLETAPLKYRTFFTLAIYSGFRRGEMLGLEWKDIDWEHNVISVRRTSNYTASKGIYTDTTKTKKSQRSLKFPQSVMDLLREYKAEQDEERIKLGTKWQDYDRLFVKWDGRPMNNNTPYFWLKEFCEENNFRFCDIHSLRHFYASALINEGVDAATVSGALGHSTITTTVNTPKGHTQPPQPYSIDNKGSAIFI